MRNVTQLPRKAPAAGRKGASLKTSSFFLFSAARSLCHSCLFLSAFFVREGESAKLAAATSLSQSQSPSSRPCFAARLIEVGL